MRLKPDFNLESIYELEAQALKMRGIKGIFFDLDSTVMRSKSGAFTERTCEFLDDLAKDFKIAIITNNKRRHYIEKVCSQCKFRVYSDAKKPDITVLKNAIKDFELEPSECALVGDRPMTDILAGHKAEMMTILVDSISKHDEHPVVRAARWLERLMVKKRR